MIMINSLGSLHWMHVDLSHNHWHWWIYHTIMIHLALVMKEGIFISIIGSSLLILSHNHDSLGCDSLYKHRADRSMSGRAGSESN